MLPKTRRKNLGRPMGVLDPAMKKHGWQQAANVKELNVFKTKSNCFATTKEALLIHEMRWSLIKLVR